MINNHFFDDSNIYLSEEIEIMKEALETGMVSTPYV